MTLLKDEVLADVIAGYQAILVALNKYNLALPPEVMQNTATRAAKALCTLALPAKPPVLTMFEEPGIENGLVVQNGIQVASVCEHHLLPFFGTATVAYVPSYSTKNKVRLLGLSKLARLVQYVAQRPNVQERITSQVAKALMQSSLQPVGVGVSLRCHHTCMSLRGPKDANAVTETEVLMGVLRTDGTLRAEFLSKVRHSAFFASA